MQFRNYSLVIALGACVGLASAAAMFQFARPFDATKTPEGLADLQAERPGSIILPLDVRYNLAFKVRRIEIVRPEIEWFATSRAGSAMAEMFRPHRFYNMAFTGWTTDQLEEAFERSTRNVRPRVAILSLDYFLFTDRWETQLRASRKMIIGEHLRHLQASLGLLARSVFTHWADFKAYADMSSRFIGPQTVLMQEGFRSDGSWHFTDAHIETAQRQFRNVQFSLDSLPGGQAMAPSQKAPIERIAQIAKQRGIKLLAVQLPYLRAGVDFLNARSANDEFYGVWHDFEGPNNRAWLESLGITFFDLSQSSLDDDPENFIDAYHPSERGMRASVGMLMQIDEFRSALDQGLVSTASTQK